MERQEEERKAAKLHTTSILDLPEVIIMYIISLLPVTSAAKCAAVTKKWLELWRSIPDWTLDYNLFPNVENKNKKFRSFVDKVVYMHQGPGIKSMKIHYVQHDQYDLISLHHTERWIRHLVQKNIVRLDINIHNQAQLPFSLFTCGTITELRLGILFKELPLKGKVLLPNLKILYLEQIKFSSQIQFERLMNGCLVLEDLHMKGCSFFAPDFNHLTFSHPNIKSLNLERCGGIGALKIYIWLPSLSEFRFNGAGLVDQEGVIDLSSVSTAVLDLDDILYTYRCRMSNGIMTSCGSNMSRILATVCHARKITLSDWCLEYLSMRLHSLHFVASDKLESLDLQMWPNGRHSYVVTQLLRCYPKLKSLKITVVDDNWGYSDGIFDDERENYPQSPDILSEELVHHNLRMLEIKGCKGYGEELRIMKFLLQTAVALENFNVDISKDEESWTVNDILALTQAPTVETKINILDP